MNLSHEVPSEGLLLLFNDEAEIVFTRDGAFNTGELLKYLKLDKHPSAALDRSLAERYTENTTVWTPSASTWWTPGHSNINLCLTEWIVELLQRLALKRNLSATITTQQQAANFKKALKTAEMVKSCFYSKKWYCAALWWGSQFGDRDLWLLQRCFRAERKSCCQRWSWHGAFHLLGLEKVLPPPLKDCQTRIA